MLQAEVKAGVQKRGSDDAATVLQRLKRRGAGSEGGREREITNRPSQMLSEEAHDQDAFTGVVLTV